MEFKQPNKQKRFVVGRQTHVRKYESPLRWFNEDREWKDLKKTVQNDSRNSKDSKTGRSTKLVLLTDGLYKSLKKRMASIYKTKILITFSAVLLIFTGIVVGNKYIFDYSSNKEVAGVNLVNGPDLPPTHDPKFDIILPKGRDITKEKIVYDPKRNFAKYEDNINSVDIIVSEQPVPEMFKLDPIYGIKKVANDFGVKELILNEGTEIYYDKNDKGMQTLIFTKKNLFIFIMTTKEVDKEAFKVYIENLD